jgi:mRNA-degrading endonuclease RelE of RelBE toxin-antitoxin system
VTSEEPHPMEPAYEVGVNRNVTRFLRRHPDLRSKWDDIVNRVLSNPLHGPHIDHLRGDWNCSYRWDEGTYRIKYEVLAETGEIHFYDANTRGDAYKHRR